MVSTRCFLYIIFDYIGVFSHHAFKVVLRDCSPGSSDYDKADIMKHLAQLHVKKMNDIEKDFLNKKFAHFLIEKEGIITKENFLTEFVPCYFIHPRQKNIDALRDGLTLNGRWG